MQPHISQKLSVIRPLVLCVSETWDLIKVREEKLRTKICSTTRDEDTPDKKRELKELQKQPDITLRRIDALKVNKMIGGPN